MAENLYRKPRLAPGGVGHSGAATNLDELVSRNALAALRRDPPPKLPKMPERPSNGLDDSDLMASMVKRLAAVEKELKEKNSQLARSQAEVEALKSKLRVAEDEIQKRAAAALSHDDSAAVAHMRSENARLRAHNKHAWKQVAEMKSFLADYGMVWVGEAESSSDSIGMPSPPPAAGGRVSSSGSGAGAGAGAAAAGAGAGASHVPRPPVAPHPEGSTASVGAANHPPRPRRSLAGMPSPPPAVAPAGASVFGHPLPPAVGIQVDLGDSPSPSHNSPKAEASAGTVLGPGGPSPTKQPHGRPMSGGYRPQPDTNGGGGGSSSSAAHGESLLQGAAARQAAGAAAEQRSKAAAEDGEAAGPGPGSAPGAVRPSQPRQPPLSEQHSDKGSASSISSARPLQLSPRGHAPLAAPLPPLRGGPPGPGAAGPSHPSPSGLPFSMKALCQALDDLNQLAGDGEGRFQGEDRMQHLRAPDPVRLTIFSDGLQLHKQPARGWSDPATQAVLSDVLDGYFPYVLKREFPDGVPIKVVDRTSETMEAAASSAAAARASNVRTFADLENAPAEPMSRKDFLSKLPQNVIRNGKVIDIRGEVGRMMEGQSANGNGGNSASGPLQAPEVVPTSVDPLLSTNQRKHVGPMLPPASREGAHEVSEVTTLQVKSEDGKQTLIIKLRFDDTIAALHKYIDTHRAKQAKEAAGGKGPAPPRPPGAAYEIRSAFPQRAYTDMTETLRDAGLVPNATIFMRALV